MQIKKGWTINWAKQILDKSPNETALSPEALIQLVNAFPVTLKDDKRSLVLKGELFGTKVIAKQPRDKNRRTWSRLLSLFRPAEAAQSFINLQRFAEHAIPAPKAIAVLQEYNFNRVVDSWLIYEFIEGVPSTKDDLPKIIGLIDRLHQFGFQHNDPHYENFLSNDGDISLIDCKGKKRLGNFSDCYDFILLNNYHPEASVDLIKRHAAYKTESLGFQLAKMYKGYKNLRGKLKKKLRKKRS